MHNIATSKLATFDLSTLVISFTLDDVLLRINKRKSWKKAQESCVSPTIWELAPVASQKMIVWSRNFVVVLQRNEHDDPPFLFVFFTRNMYMKTHFKKKKSWVVEVVVLVYKWRKALHLDFLEPERSTKLSDSGPISLHYLQHRAIWNHVTERL